MSEPAAPTYTYKHSQRQIGRLSSPTMRKTLAFAMQSIRLRLARCIITAASVVGAIAFLTYNAMGLNAWLFQVTHPVLVAPAPAAAASPAAEASQSGGDFFSQLASFTAEKSQREKQLFVMTLSLLVCFVGISNSMMMSIKERYREIATLKCLGAVNSYIRRLFMLESMLQAGAGSVFGLLLGILLYWAVQPAATEAADQRYGSGLWLLMVCGFSLTVGIIMTLVASVWPIRKALAMAPVEALRVEE